MNWWKAHHGIATDPKYRVILRHIASHDVTSTHNLRLSDITAVWVWLIDYASQNDPRGSIENLQIDHISVATGLEDSDVEVIIEAFRFRRMITGNLLTAFEKRQPSSTFRMRKSRAAAKEEASQRVTARHKESQEVAARHIPRARDGDGDGDGEVLVVTEVLSKPEVSNGRKNGTEKPNGSGHPKSNGFVSPNSSVADPARLQKIGTMIHDYLGAHSMPTERKVKPPDAAIILKCSQAIGNASLDRASELLQRLWKDQAPHMPNGPEKYAWFVSVFREHLGGHE
jgi:hypothetical protein